MATYLIGFCLVHWDFPNALAFLTWTDGLRIKTLPFGSMLALSIKWQVTYLCGFSNKFIHYYPLLWLLTIRKIFLIHYGFEWLLPPTVEMMRPPWVTSILFPSKPVLITYRMNEMVLDFPTFCKVIPILPANTVNATCSEFCLLVLRTESHDTRTTSQLFISAITAW